MGRRTAALISPGFPKRKVPRDLLLDPPRRRRRWWVWIVLIVVIAIGLLIAVDVMASEPGVGELEFQDGGISAVLLDTRVSIAVTGIVSRTEYVQRFRNPTDEWQEAVYRFPLPERAAVNFMEMRIGDRVITARVEERGAAREIYERARDEGRVAALTEQQRPNLFTQSVANVPPGAEIEVVLRYLDLARYDGGTFSLRLPLTLTPRYDPEGRAEAPFAYATDGGSHDTALDVTLTPGVDLAEITSDYHETVPARRGDSWQVRLATPTIPMDRDFVLRWTPVRGQKPTATLLVEPGGSGDYSLLMVLPPVARPDVRVPREMVFVVDTSGSMKGESMRQARASLRRALDSTLGAGDRFNIIAFDSDYRMLFPQSRPVTPDTLMQGARFIDGLVANGGTEMAAPLRAALGEQGRAGHLKHVVFMTDGAVSNEAELFGLIHEQLGESRLFTVGIGSAPNSYFMRKAAEFGRGTFTYVGDTREVGERVQDLFEKLSRPVARQVRVDWQGNAPPEFYPSRLPSLYAGEPLIVVGRSECMSGGVRVDADIAGDLWSREVPVVGVMPGAGIGALWAREKIADLEDQHHRGGDAEALRQQIVDVALAHQLISRFTSLVAVESWISRPPGQQAERGAVENRAPRGQTVAMPRTATHADLMLLLGFLAMVAALMVQLALRRS